MKFAARKNNDDIKVYYDSSDRELTRAVFEAKANCAFIREMLRTNRII